MAQVSVPSAVDALAAYKMLLDAGFTEAQARAQSEIHRMNAELQQKAVVESRKDFVTKIDQRTEISKATEEIRDYVKSEFATKRDLEIRICECTESLKKYVDERLDDADRRFDRIDRRFQQVDREFERMEKKIEGVGSNVMVVVATGAVVVYLAMGAMIFIMGRALHWSGF